jgi:hypothetical protein
MKWKAFAIRVIKRDCMAFQQYRDSRGNTCAIGALAEAAGVSVPKGTRWDGNSDGIASPSASRWVNRARKAIAKRFGLDADKQMRSIQQLNDKFENPAQRRREIIKLLRMY